jgi:hypothetical protein
MLDPKTGPSPEQEKSKASRGAKARKRRQRSLEATAPIGDQPGLRAELQRDKSYDLVQPTEAEWHKQSPETLNRNYKQAQADYFDIVSDYLDQANLATERYKNFSKSHARWRFWVIFATGTLAIINTIAALRAVPAGYAQAFSALAAIYAVALTLAANLEGFFNRGDKAAGFRESRDLLLNLYREYYYKWFYYVEAYGDTPKACINAARLYHQLVDSDQELRQKLKELTEVPTKRSIDAGARVALGSPTQA